MWSLLVLLMAAVMVTPVMLQTVETTDKVRAALLIIDVQDCFLQGGSLAIPGGEQVIPVINKVREDFADQLSLVVISQDWHCPDHVSFVSQHPGASPFSSVNLTYNSHGALCHGDGVPHDFPHAVDCDKVKVDDKVKGDDVAMATDPPLFTVSQTLWPDHCIRDVTTGATSARFSPLLVVKDSDVIVRKGSSCGIDAYSAFYDNGGFHQTELDTVLKQHAIDTVLVTGLALDYCVYFTAKDAHTLGYKVVTVTDACRGVAADSINTALQHMADLGVDLVKSADLGRVLREPGEDTVDPDHDILSAVLVVVAGGLFTAYLVVRRRP